MMGLPHVAQNKNARKGNKKSSRFYYQKDGKSGFFLFFT